MSNYKVASGQQIYDAAVAGAKQKFNRSTDDYSVYECMLNEFYELMLNDNKNKAECNRIRKRTKNNWRNANLPISLVMYHCYRAMQPCETHARVRLFHHIVFDIPLEHWQMFREQSLKYA